MKCDECGAVRPRWMGGHHECMTPTHPYADFFIEPEEIEEWREMFRSLSW